MSSDMDQEILQDFLVEAGEILEQLSAELVDLEQRADDKDLLNSIFRGFHTVKGGASFLQLDPLVNVCHIAENVFDLLRNDDLAVTPGLMDVMLRALDSVQSIFAQIQDGEDPHDADPELLRDLEGLLTGGGAEDAPAEAPATEAPVESSATTSAVSGSDDMTDTEFESLLDSLDEKKKPDAPVADSVDDDDDLFNMSSTVEAVKEDEITAEEFDKIMGHLKVKKEEKPKEVPAGGISEDEFENLLDDIHGAGSFSSDSAKVQEKIKDGPAKSVAPTIKKPVDREDVASPVAKVNKEIEEKVEPSKPSSSVKSAAPDKSSDPKSKSTAKKGKEASVSESTVRVDTKRLDDIMNMVGELVLVRNRLVRLGLKSHDEVMSKAVANLDVVTADLQTSVMKTRMQPIKKVFGRFPRVVRDLARNLKKEISLELVGEETDLDKNLVEALVDPLVHLVRNSVDHGIELPDEREAAGKPRSGTVILSAEQECDHIVLAISDDGRGMDAGVLKQKAIEKGLIDNEMAARMPDQDAYNLIFHPGFSTKDNVSDISGRGVGMDVVKTKIAQLNGSITVSSELGSGSQISIKVPLTLAIMPTLMVKLGNQAFALPLVNVNEIFHMDLSKTNMVDGQEVVVVREKALPLFYLKRWLVQGNNDGEVEENSHVVITSVGTRRVGFVVDQLIGQEEVVIKPLGALLQGTPGMAGATITGDGRIALILDVPSMLTRYS